MSTYVVTATSLNIRSQPLPLPRTRIATLPQGHHVETLSSKPANSQWWEVETRLSDVLIKGFVASQYLAKEDQKPRSTRSITEVHLTPREKIVRNSTNGRAFPLNEDGMPGSGKARTVRTPELLREVIDWLAVESSARYKRTAKTTFCNIYAYDFCYLAGAYLPRVWWSRKAIAELASGNKVEIKYGTTVSELNANSLYNWFEEFGADFGWERSFDMTHMQERANAGCVCIISAQQEDLNRSGHICAVVPENGSHHATRSRDTVTSPLQSQAGANNFGYGGRVWWTASNFRGFSFWVHP
jgi:hypothetical protein